MKHKHKLVAFGLLMAISSTSFAQIPTRLTWESNNPLGSYYGATVTFRTRLTDFSDRPVAGRQVKFFVAYEGGTLGYLGSGITNSSGWATFSQNATHGGNRNFDPAHRTVRYGNQWRNYWWVTARYYGGNGTLPCNGLGRLVQVWANFPF